MNIRARFKCYSVTHDSGKNEIVVLQAAYGTRDANDNVQWSKYTPNGKLEMTISQDGAQNQFVPGLDYYLDIAPVVTSVDG
jgi:hypothetical protein